MRLILRWPTLRNFLVCAKDLAFRVPAPIDVLYPEDEEDVERRRQLSAAVESSPLREGIAR